MIQNFRRLYIAAKPQIIGFCTLEDECPYLPQKRCRMEYKFVQNCTKELNQELVSRGWRRFGAYFSRPICRACELCLGLRIEALNFTFSKSYRRVLAKNSRTKVLLRRPNLSNEHLFLYDKYHKFMEKKRAWSPQRLTFRQYFNLYVDGAQDFGFELDFYADEKLVCVDYIDILADGISSIYCFYDPDYAHLSLGKFSLLAELKLARHRALPYIYLGYFVAECKSLAYKADYSPCQILRHASTLGESAFLWGRYDSNRAKSTLGEHKH